MPGGVLGLQMGVLSPTGSGGPYAIEMNGVDQYVDFGTVFSAGTSKSAGFTLAADPADTSLRYALGGDTAANYVLCTLGTAFRWDSTNGTGTRYVQASVPSAPARASHVSSGLARSLWINGALASSAASVSTFSSGGRLCFGRLGSSYAALTCRQFWTIEVALSSAQLGALDALIAAGDDEGAAAYLYGISTTAHYWPIGWPGDDATSGTGQLQDITPNAMHAVPYNTDSGNLVAA